MNKKAGVIQDPFISSFISQTDLLIKDTLNQLDNDLRNVLWEFMENGKRLRPYIVAGISNMLKGNRDFAVKLAACIEIYHNSTLIFDDIQDNSLLRRGKPTIHAQFGVGLAISFASVLRAMMTRTFANQLSADDSVLIYHWINKVAGMLSLGQFRELSWSSKNYLDITENDYIEMVRLKTGALIGLASLFGGISSNSNSIEELFEFGCSLGIAYQIYDDIKNVDKTSDQHKDKYSDIYSKKVSILIIHSIQFDGKLKNILMNIFSKHEINESDTWQVLQIFQESKAIEYSRNIANEYLQKAIGSLMQVKESDSILRVKFINEIKEIFKYA
jgi:geranylgeranyl diphosphate synthase type I